jgi:hypothetical protein
VIAATLIGIVLDGFGGGVLAAALSALVFGPAYLIQNQVRRRRGTLVAPPPRAPAEKAALDARLLRAMAIGYPILGAGQITLTLMAPEWWVPESWAPAFVIATACAISEAPFMWALADRQLGRQTTWAWALAGGLDVLFGVAAIVVAVTNVWSGWIGGGGWTAVLLVLGVLWLLGAPSNIRRARS